MEKPKYSIISQLIINYLTWMVLLPILVIFAFYRKIVDIILTMKVGAKYGGLLTRADTIFWAPDPSKYYITNVLYIKSKEKVDVFAAVKDIFQKKVFKHPDVYAKLTSSVQQFAGYCYWLKNEIKVSDVIMPLTPPDGTKITEEYVRDFATKISNADFKDGVCWDNHITTEPMIDKDGLFRYVLVTRVHHCICDGTSLIALFIKLLGDDSAQNYGVEIYNKLMKPQPKDCSDKSFGLAIRRVMMDIEQRLWFWLDLIFLAMGRVMIQTVFISNDKNSLHGDYTNYSSEKVVAWTTEDNPECIALVKKIKSKTNTQFVSVLSTAVVDALSSYFVKHSLEVPNHISGLMTVLVEFPKIDPTQPVKLENKTSWVMYRFPTTHQLNSLIDVLKSNCAIMRNREKYTESLIARFIVSYALGSLPLCMQQPSIGFNKQTMVITNVPGGSQVKMFDGCVVEKVIPIVPNSRGVGLSIAILSYDDRFQVSVLVDKSLQKSQKGVQTISDGILDSIRRLHAECHQC